MLSGQKSSWEVHYLSKEHLDGFDSYKYSAVDTNPLSIYIMHPFWNQVVKVCPKWVAPNLLTFVGFLFTLGAFFLLAYFDPHFYASSRDHPEAPPIPNVVFLIAAIAIFIAYTLDGIDGKQARRTQTSGPVGELFDHGLDSWTAVLIPTSLYSVFGRSEHSIAPIRLYFVLWNVFLNFYISHWEKYNTRVLNLPWGYDISMLMTVLIFLVTGTWGYALWKFDLWFGINAGDILELFFYLSAILWNIPTVLYNIYLSYKNRTGKLLSFSEAMRPLVPVFSCFIIGSFGVLSSPSGVVATHPRLLYFMTGTLFSNICCRLIVSQMSNTRCDASNWLLLPLAISAILSTTTKGYDAVILYILTAIVLVAHVHYGACVVRQMCRHFRIYCFRIRKPDD